MKNLKAKKRFKIPFDGFGNMLLYASYGDVRDVDFVFDGTNHPFQLSPNTYNKNYVAFYSQMDPKEYPAHSREWRINDPFYETFTFVKFSQNRLQLSNMSEQTYYMSRQNFIPMLKVVTIDNGVVSGWWDYTCIGGVSGIKYLGAELP